MDIYSSRSAGFGFVFVFFSMLVWYCNDPNYATSQVLALLSDKDGNEVSLVAALVGGVVGLPIVGRSFEFVAVLLAELMRGRSDSFPEMQTRGNEIAAELAIEGRVDAKGLYHLIFYSECDPKLRDWSHRRRNRMYASVTNVLAAVSAVAVASVMMGDWKILPLAASAMYSAVNIRVFFVELRYHDKMIEAWWTLYREGKPSNKKRTINLNVNSSKIND